MTHSKFKRGLEDYLRQSKKIWLLHNADDIILDDGELNYLIQVFGPRAKIYPRGGHCGNLAHRVTLGYIVDYFRNPLPAVTAQSMIEFPREHGTPDISSNPQPFPTKPAPAAGVHILNGHKPYQHYLDLRDQIDRRILVLERRLEESHSFLKAAQARQKTSEDQGDALLLVSGGKVPDSATRVIEPPKRSVEEVVRPEGRYQIDVYDPIEGFNRGMYKFNAKFDEYVFLPVVEGYEAVMPDFFEDRISNFFTNIADLRNLLNSILQLKGETTLRTLSRLLINSTFGLGGLFNHATPLGLYQQTEDFGQTLGHYGLDPGAFVVLPIFGPSSVRDTTGLLTDAAARYFYLYTPVNFDNNIERSFAATLVWAVDTRHQLTFRYYQTGSPFEYDLVRFLYTKKREIEIEK